jgi:hypothetical protein
MYVNLLEFVIEMTKRWQTKNNTVSNALKDSWQQLADTLNTHIAGNNSRRWSVLHPPTGTGKSLGLALYCTMLPRLNHPGVLIVVRMKKDADDLAKSINSRACVVVAIATHTDSTHDKEEEWTSPVLIATHSAYLHAIQSQPKRESLTSWQGGKRKLTVIDEALDIIQYEQVSLDELRVIRGHLPRTTTMRYPLETKKLDEVIALLEGFADVSITSIHLDSKKLEHLSGTTFSGLRQALKTLPLDNVVLHIHDHSERYRLVERHSNTLAKLEAMLSDWCLYAPKGVQHMLSTSRVILPSTGYDAVILDATAHLNPLYEMLGNTVQLITPPENMRNYGNVVLNVSKGHRVGKGSLSKHKRQDAENFITGIAQHVGTDRKLLVCTHKVVMPMLKGYGDHFAAYDVANWGAIDGKNDWRGYDAVAVFGLAYLDRIQPETMVYAFQRWSKHTMRKSEFGEMVERLYWGHISVTVVQAINRTRCRGVVDERGSCASTDVYLLLPPEKQAHHIIAAIVQAMPGIRQREWSSPVAKKRLRRSGYEAPLLSYLKGLGRGRYLAKEVRMEIGIKQRAFEKLIAKIKDDTSLLSLDLLKIGCNYVPETGRAAKSCFVIDK